eukprot:scaffold102030_cov32-Tisochrysis_lutea.AAC.1
MRARATPKATAATTLTRSFSRAVLSAARPLSSGHRSPARTSPGTLRSSSWTRTASASSATRAISPPRRSQRTSMPCFKYPALHPRAPAVGHRTH